MSSFTTKSEGDVLIVQFETASELNDFRNNAVRDALYSMIQSGPEANLAVDLERIDYLSSSGLAILVGLKRRIEARGGKAVFYQLQPVVRDLLAVTKLDRFFQIVDDESRALSSLRSAPAV